MLGNFRTGINRLREKGGASPEAFYDLVNGHLTSARSVRNRPAAIHAFVRPPGTKGLMLFRDKFVVFSSENVASTDPQIEVEILKHPNPESSATLSNIHYAMPFLNYPYVVAEWSDGVIKHYWLETAESWQANHVYREGQVIMPTVPSGYGYRATRLGGAAQPWAANVERAIGDKVEPTTPSGFEHTVIDVQGDKPRSGATEPTWAKTEGGITYEDADNPPPASSGGAGGGGATLPPEVDDRYGGNSSGGGGFDDFGPRNAF